METIRILPKELNPGVILSKDTREFKIYGTSCPMDPEQFYEPLIHWFNKYLDNPLQETVFEIFFSYFDTASSKFLLHIFYKLEDLQDLGSDVKVKWFYLEEDEDMLEEAEEFENVIYLDFEIIAVENEDVFEDDTYFLNEIESVI
jgi:hypothetical protein